MVIAADPITVVVQSAPTPIWQLFLSPIIGLLGVGVGAYISYLATRRQAERAYTRERKDRAEEDLYQAVELIADMFDKSMFNEVWDAFRQTKASVYQKFADGNLAIRITRYSTPEIAVLYSSLREKLSSMDLLDVSDLDPETEIMGLDAFNQAWNEIEVEVNRLRTLLRADTGLAQ